MSGIDWFGDGDDPPPQTDAEPLSVADCYCQGRIRPNAMDEAMLDAVDAWHNGGSGKELYEYLGFTEEEYGVWLLTNDAVSILDKRPKPNGGSP